MTTKTIAEPQQDQQLYQKMARDSATHTRDYIRKLAEINKEMSGGFIRLQPPRPFSQEPLGGL